MLENGGVQPLRWDALQCSPRATLGNALSLQTGSSPLESANCSLKVNSFCSGKHVVRCQGKKTTFSCALFLPFDDKHMII